MAASKKVLPSMEVHEQAPETAPDSLMKQVPVGLLVGTYKTSMGWVVFRKALLQDDLERSQLYARTMENEDGESVRIVPTMFETILQNLRCSFVAAEFEFDPTFSVDELLEELKGKVHTEDLVMWNLAVMDLNPLWDTRRDF